MKKLSQIEFEALIGKYSPILLNKAYYLLSNKQDAEDVVQEVFISAYESYQNYRGKSSLQAWLMGILYNKVSDLYKHKYRQGIKTSITHIPEFDKNGDWIDGTENINLLDDYSFRFHFYNCLDTLPDKWKILVKLYYLKGNDSESICKELGISKTNCWKILQRSRLHLRKCIDSKISKI